MQDGGPRGPRSWTTEFVLFSKLSFPQRVQVGDKVPPQSSQENVFQCWAEELLGVVFILCLDTVLKTKLNTFTCFEKCVHFTQLILSVPGLSLLFMTVMSSPVYMYVMKAVLVSFWSRVVFLMQWRVCVWLQDFDRHESMEYKPQKKAFFKLKDCIELFTTMEKLGAEDPWWARALFSPAGLHRTNPQTSKQQELVPVLSVEHFWCWTRRSGS